GGQFCCAAQRPSRCGRLRKAACPPGGLRETAWYSKAETREDAAPQADDAEAQQCTEGGAIKEILQTNELGATDPRACRSARPAKSSAPSHAQPLTFNPCSTPSVRARRGCARRTTLPFGAQMATVLSSSPIMARSLKSRLFR